MGRRVHSRTWVRVVPLNTGYILESNEELKILMPGFHPIRTSGR